MYLNNNIKSVVIMFKLFFVIIILLYFKNINFYYEKNFSNYFWFEMVFFLNFLK